MAAAQQGTFAIIGEATSKLDISSGTLTIDTSSATGTILTGTWVGNEPELQAQRNGISLQGRCF